jgi:hypothetical protein
MKKYINKSIFLLSLILVAFVACDDVETIQINPEASTVVSLSQSTLVLTEENAENDVITVSWPTPDFGFDAAPSYNLLIDVAGGNFSAAQIIPNGALNEKVFTGAELNNKLLSLGLTPDEEVEVAFKVHVILSPYQDFMSEAQVLVVTPFSSLLDLSTNLGVVGSATPGGWGNENIPDLPFYTTTTPDVYVAYVTLRDGEIKFRKDNLWTENYGDTGNDGVLDSSGDNIAVNAGTYKITVNMATLEWEMEDYSWGIVGNGTLTGNPSGWDAPDTRLHYNSFNDDWRTVATFVDGEIKFRFNEDWPINYGDNGADGTFDQNGDNIAVSAGHYLVIVNFNTGEYSIEAMDVWGLVGSATENSWDGPNQKFIPDFGINEGYYYIQGAVLSDGEIKVRQNDAWGVNYGDTGNDGEMELNGDNIPVSAGIYNITLNFSVDPPTIEIYQW